MTPPFPFTAVVGQAALKRALVVNAVDPGVGGVLVRGHKGTAKSTAVRALAALLPPVEVVAGCPYSCDPASPDAACPAGPHDGAGSELRPTRLVELPVGASEDRVAGSLDIEQALTQGARAFEPGLLARAHRGILYVDEVNLLHDHLVDLLLDAAAMGTNHVEREGVSVRHAARFLLVGTMNPEEGELRPQLLDRFGLAVEVAGPADPAARATVVRRRLAYEADPHGFAHQFAEHEQELAGSIVAARKLLADVDLPDQELDRIVRACAAFDVDGLRADIVTARAARVLAAWGGRRRVDRDDVRAAALLALPHRRRRDPFDDPGIEPDELDRVLGDDEPDPDGGPGGDGPDGGGRGPGGGADRGSRDGPPGRGGSEVAGGGPPAAAAPPPRSDRSGAPASADAGTAGDRPVMAAEGAAGQDAGERRDGGAGGAGAQVHPTGAAFRPQLLAVPGTGAGAAGRRSPARADHGSHVGAQPATRLARAADLAVAATLRAAAPHQRARGASGRGLVLRRSDLHAKVRQGREGNLVVFAVDASGSMGARRRMVAVKGAVRSLLLDAYQRRDKVALVSFRGGGARLVLPPTASPELADRRLADLPTGGRTPLAAGLRRVAALLAIEATRDPDRRPLVVVVTDGRANAPRGGDPVGEALAAARALAARRVAAVVVDSEEGYVRLGLAAQVARALRAPCLRLEELAAGPLAGTVRALRGRGRAA